jgi:iron complex transport system substrate-binding protein
MPRIASLIPSATEIVAALDFTESLVARSHSCDFPVPVRALPACTEPKIDIAAPSAAIDRDIKALLSDGLSVYRVDAEKLRALAPDVIVTQTQCEVCAVSEAELETALADWLENRPTIVSLAPNRIADIWSDIQKVADALGAPERGRDLVRGLEIRMAAIAARAAEIGERPGVACIEWIEPLMSGGNWMPELIEMAGGTPLFGKAGEHSPWIDWAALAEADPDVILIMPCGFDMARTRAELAPLTGRGGWQDLRAVREDRVFIADGDRYFNRPGPRIVESLEILAEILHPGKIRFGRRGDGWEVL